MLRYIRPRLNQKRMKIIVFAKKFSASSCNIFITFQMFNWADIWFFGFFRKFQPNYFWSKMFSRYGCLKILFTNVKIPCKVDTSHHYILFSAGARSSRLLDRPFSKGLFTPPRTSLKTLQMFSVHTTPEEFLQKTKQSPAILDLCFRKKLGQRNYLIIARSSVSKSSVFKCSSSTRKLKAGVFTFLRFKERFRKAPFSWRISEDGRSNRRNKAAFSNSSGVMCTGPEKSRFLSFLG